MCAPAFSDAPMKAEFLMFMETSDSPSAPLGKSAIPNLQVGDVARETCSHHYTEYQRIQLGSESRSAIACVHAFRGIVAAPNQSQEQTCGRASSMHCSKYEWVVNDGEISE
jgi:hypothetical protein